MNFNKITFAFILLGIGAEVQGSDSAMTVSQKTLDLTEGFKEVSSCQEYAVADCESFRGRANPTMGSAARVIWKVGTRRIVSIHAASASANAVISQLNFQNTLFADFVGCPLQKDIPGHRMPYCIESISNVRWEISH